MSASPATNRFAIGARDVLHGATMISADVSTSRAAG